MGACLLLQQNKAYNAQKGLIIAMMLESQLQCRHDCGKLGTDWVEHVMETGGEPYLQSPEASMSIFVRHSVDVYSMILLTVGLGLFVAWEALLHACSYLARARTCIGGSRTSFANVMCRLGLFSKITKLKFS